MDLIPVAVVTFGKKFVNEKWFRKALNRLIGKDNSTEIDLTRALPVLGRNRVGFMEDGSYSKTVMAIFGQIEFTDVVKESVYDLIEKRRHGDSRVGTAQIGHCNQGLHRADLWGRVETCLLNMITDKNGARVFNAVHFRLETTVTTGDIRVSIDSVAEFLTEPFVVEETPRELFGKTACKVRRECHNTWTEINDFINDVLMEDHEITVKLNAVHTEWLRANGQGCDDAFGIGYLSDANMDDRDFYIVDIARSPHGL